MSYELRIGGDSEYTNITSLHVYVGICNYSYHLYFCNDLYIRSTLFVFFIIYSLHIFSQCKKYIFTHVGCNDMKP
jgi:hypothetical protein